MKEVEVSSYPVSIFIAGDVLTARESCQNFCDDVGLCVTVTETSYIYTGGCEEGVVVGLINYPRFPSTPSDIWSRAEALTQILIEDLEQESATIQAPDRTKWISYREEDQEDDI